jgi:diadenosine tetraphosphatase ApaH/serine/threonine PP2A family protein phosphatase
MTIIYAHISDDSQVLVADRRLTRADGTIVAEDEYKLVLYKNVAQGYQVGVAVTGLARDGYRHNTCKWLLDILPATLIEDVSVGAGLDMFAAACTDCLARLRVATPLTATTFVFCGTMTRLASHLLNDRIHLVGVVSVSDKFIRQGTVRAIPDFCSSRTAGIQKMRHRRGRLVVRRPFISSNSNADGSTDDGIPLRKARENRWQRQLSGRIYTRDAVRATLLFMVKKFLWLRK